MTLRKDWWKFLALICAFYTCTAGLLGGVPAKPILNETIRNLYFHVAMWMVMMILFIVSLVYSLLYLRRNRPIDDVYAFEFARGGCVFGALGLITGSLWAKYTWGSWWSNDPKQIGAAIAMLIYLAYFILRNSLTDADKAARIGAVYNVFAFAMLFPTLLIIPRMVESLHPGGVGNPAFNRKDTDPRMIPILWLGAVPGWTLLGVWIVTLRIRMQRIILNQDRNV